MKNLHPARRRLLIGVLFVACAFFYAFAPTCGLVGQFVHFATSRLLGQTGSSLLAITLFVVGTLLIVPHGAVGSLIRWALHGRDARVAKVVYDMDATIKRRRALADSAVVSGEIVTKAPQLAPVDRRQLDKVRDALKGLGYFKNEYEPLVTKMDPTVSFENLVRGAIKQLSVRTN